MHWQLAQPRISLEGPTAHTPTDNEAELQVKIKVGWGTEKRQA
jgi:hypothetical protein